MPYNDDDYDDDENYDDEDFDDDDDGDGYEVYGRGYGYGWRPYVPVGERRARAKKQMEKLRKKGKDIQPVEIAGRLIARSFWGKGWCDHLESFSDYANRLPRGRTYVRNGSVCHLDVQPGRIEAFVSGSELYTVAIKVKPLPPEAWKNVKEQCSGKVGSMLELLQGKLSNHVMAVVSDRQSGLFPKPKEIKLECSCPDWASMCKHVAAALYGVGSRLDARPELLFLLRGVDASELIAAEVALPQVAGAGESEDALGEAALGEIFGIDLEQAPAKRKTAGKPAKAASAPHRHDKTEEKARQVRTTGKQKPKPAARAKKAPKPASSAPGPSLAFDPEAPTGAAIAQLRKQLDLSTAAFARLLGVSPASVVRWEASSEPLKLHNRPLQALKQAQKKLRR